MVLTIFCGTCFQKNSTIYPSTTSPFLSIAGAKSSPDPDELVASAPDPTTARVNVVGVTLGGIGLLVLGGEKPAAWDRNLVLKKKLPKAPVFQGENLQKTVAFLGFEIFRGELLFADCIMRFEIHHHFFHQPLGSECFLELETQASKSLLVPLRCKKHFS